MVYAGPGHELVENRMNPLDTLAGRITDLDSHEMVPAKLWGDLFGPSGDLFGGLFSAAAAVIGKEDHNSLLLDVDTDDLPPINRDSVWKRANIKSGAQAPGAWNMEQRLAVLDFMGVNRQLLFPTACGAGLTLNVASLAFLKSFFGITDDAMPLQESDLHPLGKGLIRGWNDWCIETAKIDPDRLRPVGLLLPDNLDGVIEEAERLLAGGVRAVWIPASLPPCGKSPADVAISPLWSFFEEADVAVTIHILQENFMQSTKWREIPEFLALESGQSAEFVLDPWSMATLHMPVENYLMTMVLGGVFERHPRLRFGVVECGAHWVGPMAENLDRWAGVFSRRMSGMLSMKPSEYLARNVRVTGFIFEPIAQYIDRYGLEDVYCYGSDYPHYEGGTDQLERFAEDLGRLGPEIMEKFFVTNGELLVPPLKH